MLRLSSAILGLYPQAWRDCYEDELRALLEDRQLTLATLIDLLWGALDAHLDPGGLVPSPRRRMRGTLAAAASCGIALVMLGAGFAKATEDVPFRIAGRAHPLLADARMLVIVLAVGCAAVAVLAGVPLAYTILRQAWRERTRPLVHALGVMAAAGAFLVVVTVALALSAGVGGAFATRPRTVVNGPAPVSFLFFVYTGLVVLVAIVVALTARRALMAARFGAGQLVLGVAAAWLLARIMVALTLAVALYALLLVIDSPSVASSPNGPLRLSTTMVLGSQVVGMLLASVLASVSTRRGLRALRAG